MTAPVVSEARAPIGSLQQITSLDLTAIGVLSQGSTDNVVSNILMSGVGYTGLGVTASGASAVSVSPGYLIKGGPGYSLRDAATLDLAPAIAMVPDSSKSLYVLIVVDGQETTEQDTRTFEDASLKPTDPTALWPTVTLPAGTRVVRTAVPSKITGTADVQPQAPSYNPTLCLIATVVVSNTGIVSVTQNTDTQITRHDQIVQLVNALVAFQSMAQPLLASLQSSVSGLALQFATSFNNINQVLALIGARLTALESRVSTPAGASLSGVDQFVDLSQTDATVTGYEAVIAGGLHFPLSGSTNFTVQPQAPYATYLSNLATNKNLLTPDFGLAQAVASVGVNVPYYAAGSFPYLNFQSLAVYNATFSKRSYAIQRTRFGKSLKPTATTSLLANGDPNQIFGIDTGDLVYDPSWGDWRDPTLELRRGNGFSRDLASRDYWSPIAATAAAGGVPALFVPYTAAGAQMIGQIKFDIRNVETNGNYSGAPVRCVVAKSVNGSPDIFNVLADLTQSIGTPTQQAQAQYPFTTFEFDNPILVNPGETIFFILLTTGGYAIRMISSSGQGQSAFGTPLAMSNGGLAPLSAYKEAAAIVNTANFEGAPSVTVPLQPLGLTGGIDLVDIACNCLVPQGCALDFQFFIGGSWVTAADIGTGVHPLTGRPSNLPMQAVFSGTAAVMPIIDLAHTKIKVSALGGTLQHDSSTRTPAANVSKVSESLIIDNWDSMHHTATAKLLSGTGFATAAAPTTTVDVIQPDGSLLRTWSWTGLNLQAHKVEIDGTASDATNPWVGRQANFSAST